jgi:hypothetical protein
MPRQFTADVARSDGDRSRIFSDGVRQRVKRHGPDGVQSIVIGRPDRGVAWSLVPGSRAVYETPLAPEAAQSTLDPTSVLDWQEEGAERVDGVECVRYRGNYEVAAAGAAYELCFVERATGVRRRSVTFDATGAERLTVEWSSVTLEPPDPTVFEIPEGYSVERLGTRGAP